MTDEFEFVLEQIADESRAIRSINLTHLSDLGRARAAELHHSLVGLSAARRRDLVSAMAEQAESNIHLNFHAILRLSLADEDAELRRLAIEGLWEDERSSLVAPLAKILVSDPAPEVRAAAAISLGRFVLLGVLGEIDAAPAAQAIQALQDAWDRATEPPEVRRRALEGLAYTNESTVRSLINLAYYDDDQLMRQSAVFAMGRTADRGWGRFILAELAGYEPALRFEAAIAAGELGLKPAVTPLIRMLDDSDSNVREAAAVALGKIGGSTARRALEAVAQSSDERLAEAAEEALAELMFNRENLAGSLMEYDQADLEGAASPAGREGDSLRFDDEEDDLAIEDEEDDLFIDDGLGEDDESDFDEVYLEDAEWDDEDLAVEG
jgi:HEAT repeat protein